MLLSICVPTYNRPKELGFLASSFLSRALQEYGDSLEVLVSDNSEGEVASENEHVLFGRIRYSRNEGNIGYAGNIAKCLGLARGEYVWIISDDDLVDWDGFQCLMGAIRENPDVDVFMLPVRTRTAEGALVDVNTSSHWELPRRVSFRDVLLRSRIPFLFIASAVLKTGGSGSARSWAEIGKNDYFHAVAFLRMLSAESRVFFLDMVVVSFGSNPEIRFSVRSISESVVEILRLIRDRFSISVSYRGLYEEHLKWLLFDRIGLLRIRNASVDSRYMRKLLLRHFSIRSFGYWSLLFLPRPVLGRMYAIRNAVKRLVRVPAIPPRPMEAEPPSGTDVCVEPRASREKQ